jgi:hypothetical protein
MPPWVVRDPAFTPTTTLTIVSGVLQRLQIDNACPAEQWGGIQWYTTDGRYVRLHVAPRMKLDWDDDEFRTHDLPTNVDDINPDFSGLQRTHRLRGASPAPHPGHQA